MRDVLTLVVIFNKKRQTVFYPQQLCSEDGDGGRSIADFIILNLRHVCKHKSINLFYSFSSSCRTKTKIIPQILNLTCSLFSRHSAASLTNQDFGSRVVDADGFQDGRSIVGHRHRAAFPSTEQDLVLKRKTRRHCSMIFQTTSSDMREHQQQNQLHFIRASFQLGACFYFHSRL